MVINNDAENEIEPKPKEPKPKEPKPKEPKPKHDEKDHGDKIGDGWKLAHERMKKSMKTKFGKEWGHNKCDSKGMNIITDKKTKYLRLGYMQNPRKIEMAKCGAATTKKRGAIPLDLKPK